MVEKQPNGNGKQRGHEPVVNEASARDTYPGAFHYRPVLAGEADVLDVPWRIRWRWRWDEMVRQTARQVGVNSESKLRLVPIIVGLVTFAMSVAAIILAVGVWKGRTETAQAMEKESRLAIERQISALEARAAKQREEDKAVLVEAAGELKDSLQDMRAEMAGEVATIRSMVGASQADMARQEARLDALSKENDRLLVNWEVLEMRRQKLENQLRAQGLKID